MKKLSKIFNCWYGVNLELINCEEDNTGIPFVSRTSCNNGVVARVSPIKGITPNPKHTLSLAGGGSVLSCFYQDEPYYSGRDLFVLSPIDDMSKEEMILYSYIISANKYKYNYGRQANKTFQDLILPELSELKHFTSVCVNADYQFDKKSMYATPISLGSVKWDWFVLSEIFEQVYKGKSYNAQDLIFLPFKTSQSLPYATRTDENNGIKGFVLNNNFSDIESSNAITIGDTTSTIYYQDSDFICGEHIVILRSQHLNKYRALFIVSILNKERFRYCYGRAYTLANIKKTKLLLPVKQDGTLNWEFMENYIKSLPYSSNI